MFRKWIVNLSLLLVSLITLFLGSELFFGVRSEASNVYLRNCIDNNCIVRDRTGPRVFSECSRLSRSQAQIFVIGNNSNISRCNNEIELPSNVISTAEIFNYLESKSISSRDISSNATAAQAKIGSNSLDGINDSANVTQVESCLESGKSIEECFGNTVSNTFEDSGQNSLGQRATSRNGTSCQIVTSNIKNERSGTTFDYSLENCTGADGQPAPKANTQCIAGTEKTNQNNEGTFNNLRLFCNESPSSLTFNDGNSLNLYDVGNCFLFRTAKGSICISEAEIKKACGDNSIIGSVATAKCLIENREALIEKIPEFQSVVATAGGLADDFGGSLPSECLDLARATKEIGSTSFQCVGKTFNIEGDTITDSETGVSYNISSGSAINKGSIDNNNDDGLFGFLWRIVAFAVAILFFLLNFILTFLTTVIGAASLFLLDINPAGPDLVQVAAKPWRLLAGVGNMMILGAFLYTGIGYLLNIDNLKSNIGEFLQKIIYYALLLNSTLLGAATLVNIGYGIGNLIKVAYAGGTGDEANSELIGGMVDSISRISYIRCGKFSADCVLEDDSSMAMIFSNAGKAFESSSEATIAAIAEGSAFFMMLIVIFLFARLMYLVLFRLAGIWMLMILSPVALASFFSPVESWQGIGKTMFNKLLQFVAFYPIFIFALILVSLLSRGFQGYVEEGFGDSSASIFTRDGILNSLFASVYTVLGAIVSMMALYLVQQYFFKQFEEDIGKIGSGIKDTYDGAVNLGRRGIGFVKGAGNVVNYGAKAIGGGVTKAGQLASFFDKGYKKEQKDIASQKAAERAQLAKKFSNAKTEDERQEIRTQMAKVMEEEQNATMNARYGRGRTFIQAGNSIGFAGDRLAGASKNLYNYFKNQGEARVAEDKLYWDTAMNSTLKDMGFDPDQVDSLLNEAANIGITREMQQMEYNKALEAGSQNSYTRVLNDRVDQARKNALKISERKLRNEQASSAIDFLIKQAKGDINNLRESEKRIFEQIIDQASQDEVLGRQLFADSIGRGMVQQMDREGRLNGDTLDRLTSKWGSALGNEGQRKNFGAALASSEQLFRDTDQSVYYDSAVLEGYVAAGGDLSKLKDNGVYNSGVIESMGKQVDELGGEALSIKGNQNLERLAATANRELNTQGYQAGLILEQDLARIQTDDSLDAEGKNTEVEKAYELSLLSEVGIPGLDAKENKDIIDYVNRMNLDQLGETFVGSTTIASLDKNWDILNKDHQEKLLRRVVAQRAMALKANKALYTEQAKQVAKVYADARRSLADRATLHGTTSEIIAQIKGENEAEIKAILNGSSKGNQSKTKQIHRAFGAEKIMSDLEKAIQGGNAGFIQSTLSKLGINMTPAEIHKNFLRQSKIQRDQTLTDMSILLAHVSAHGSTGKSYSKISKEAKKKMLEAKNRLDKKGLKGFGQSTVGLVLEQEGQVDANNLSTRTDVSSAVANKADEFYNTGAKFVKEAEKAAKKIKPDFSSYQEGFDTTVVPIK